MLALYDIVQIVDLDGTYREIDRLFGVVLGVSEADDGYERSYMIDVHTDVSCKNRVDGWCVTETCLAQTGRTAERSAFETGTSLRVSKDGQVLD